MQMPEVGPEHRRLAVLAGEFAGTEELAATSWSPAGTATAQVRARRDLGGFTLIQDYTQRRDAHVSFTAHTVFTVDPATGETLYYGFDSYGFPPDAPARGGWEGDVLTLTKTTARGMARHVLAPTADGYRH